MSKSTAKIEARQSKMDNNGEMPRPTKEKKPGLPTGKVQRTTYRTQTV